MNATSIPNPASQQGAASTRLLRDIGINVVANLIAAAIVYLLGAIAGLFPRDPAIIAAAAIFPGSEAEARAATIGRTGNCLSAGST